MLINQTYLRRLPSLVNEMDSSKLITPVLKNPERFLGQLALAGFSRELKPGELVLPDSSLGPKARFNSKGRFIIHRDRPLEAAQRIHRWTYKQRHGKDEVEVEDSKMLFYKRHPRTFIPPPSLVLSVGQTVGGDKLIVAQGFPPDRDTNLVNSINLLLEIGHECELLDERGEPIVRSPEISLDWEVLPKGRMPWAKVREHLESSLPAKGSKRRDWVLKRIEFLEGFGPDFHAYGHAGYSGYLVFGFSPSGLFVCESTELNNATYVFDSRWDEFTQLTKAEVIRGDFAVERIVHLPTWKGEISRLLKNGQARKDL